MYLHCVGSSCCSIKIICGYWRQTEGKVQNAILRLLEDNYAKNNSSNLTGKAVDGFIYALIMMCNVTYLRRYGYIIYIDVSIDNKDYQMQLQITADHN